MSRCSFFLFIPLSWENLPELIHPSQRMNFQSGISRIFQCGSSFVNLASVAYVAGKGNVNRIWSLGQCGLPHLFQRKILKNKKIKQGHLAQAMSMMEQRSGVVSTCPSRQHIAAMHFGVSNQKTWEKKQHAENMEHLEQQITDQK